MSIDIHFAAVIIKLLKGPVYDEDTDWKHLLVSQKKVREYFEVLGIELIFIEEEGFAYIRQKEGDEYDEIPRLVSRRRISFEATLLCVILREKLERFDSDGQAAVHKLYLEKREIRESIRYYFKDKTDETSLYRDLDKYINQVENLGFLKKVNTPAEGEDIYEVKRIIKAKVDPEFLEDFKKRMEIYVNAL